MLLKRLRAQFFDDRSSRL